MNSAKISVIIPVYNVEAYLKECLQSLTNQTFGELEFICINDGSTDNSLEILNEFAKKDNRFVIITQENQGQGIARNNGMKIAKGEYIAFVDPDDWLETNAFEILYNKLKETNAKIIHFDYFTFNEINKKTHIKTYNNEFKKFSNHNLEQNGYYNWHDFSQKGWLKQYSFAVWNKIYNTEFIKNNNIKCAPTKHGEDHLFTIPCLLLADKILYLEKPLYHYRSRLGSAVNKASDDNFCVFDNINMLKNFLMSHNLLEKIQTELKDYIITIFSRHYAYIPEKSIKRYMDKCSELLSENDFKILRSRIKMKPQRFWEKIFSIKNNKKYGIKYKVITILGITLNINKPKNQPLT